MGCCELKTCCCCFSLRTGCISAAIYTVVLGVMGGISQLNNAIKATKHRQDYGGSVELEEVTAWVTFLFYALWVVSGILLIIGVCTKKRGYLMPWIVMTIIMTIIAIWNIVTYIIALVDDSNVTTGEWFAFALAIFLVVISVYAIMVVCSYYRNNMMESV